MLRIISKLKNSKRILAIFSVAMLLRFLWIMLVETLPFSDFLWYHNLALSVVCGKGYRIFGYLTAFEPVGYPAFLTVLYKLFTPNIMVPKIANVVLSGVTLFLTYRLALLGISKKGALVSLLILSLLPLSIIYCSVLSTETLFTALFLTLAHLILRWEKRLSTYALMGLVLGYMALIKPYMLIFQFFILLFELSERKKIKSSILHFVIISLTMAVVILPWTLRNFTVFHKIIPISTNGGYNLYVNNNPYAIGGWQNPFTLPDSPLAKYKVPGVNYWDEVKVDEDGKKLALQWILENPVRFAQVGLKKLQRVFVKHDDGVWAVSKLAGERQFPYRAALSNINYVVHRITLIFLLIYFALLWRRKRKGRIINSLHRFIFLNLFFYIFITFIFEGQPRYLFPLWPFYSIIIGYVAVELTKMKLLGKWKVKNINNKEATYE